MSDLSSTTTYYLATKEGLDFSREARLCLQSIIWELGLFGLMSRIGGVSKEPVFGCPVSMTDIEPVQTPGSMVSSVHFSNCFPGMLEEVDNSELTNGKFYTINYTTDKIVK